MKKADLEAVRQAGASARMVSVCDALGAHLMGVERRDDGGIYAVVCRARQNVGGWGRPHVAHLVVQDPDGTVESIRVKGHSTVGAALEKIQPRLARMPGARRTRGGWIIGDEGGERFVRQRDPLGRFPLRW